MRNDWAAMLATRRAEVSVLAAQIITAVQPVGRPGIGPGQRRCAEPASDTPATGALPLAKIFEEAGLPPGVLNVIIGKSSEFGDLVASLELGGNGPMVVLDDADLERAIGAAVFGSYFHRGQVCMATNRVIVDAAIHDEFVDKFCERVVALRTGNPADPATKIGPIIDAKQVESIVDKINRAESQGAEARIRGEAGMTPINDTTINDEPSTAFGGEKNSGIGRFGGQWVVDEFTTDHWISVQHTARHYAI